MKTFTSAFQTQLDQPVSTLCACMKIVRPDGTTYLYTNHDKDIVVNSSETYDGTYISTYSFIPTAFKFSSDLAIDNFDLTNVIDDINITEIEVVNNLFNGSQVWYFTANYDTSTGEVTVTDGINKVFYGTIGNISYTNKKYTAEVRSISAKLGKKVGHVFGKTCRTTLGSAKCGIIIEPTVWTFNTAYEVGDYVKASTYDGRRYKCTTAGTSNSADVEPTWDTIINNTTNEAGDGTCVWTTKDSYVKEEDVQPKGVWARYFRFTVDATHTSGNSANIYEWQGLNNAGTNVFLNKPTTDSGNFSGYPSSLAVDGSTGGNDYWRSDDTTMPEWIQVDIGAPEIIERYRYFTTSGSATRPKSWTITASLNNVDWFTIDQHIDDSQTAYAWTPYWEFTYADGPVLTETVESPSRSIIESPNFADYADDFFKYGTLEWTSGNNNGALYEIKRNQQTPETIELFLPTKYSIQIGDTFKATVGCNRQYLGSDGTIATGDCQTKYSNAINFRAEPFIPSEDILIGGSGVFERDES